MPHRLRGAITALVTPFHADGSIDEAALGNLVEWQITEGIHGIVPVGSTGEAVTLNLNERERVVRITAERAKGRVPIIAGAGSNDTAAAIEASKRVCSVQNVTSENPCSESVGENPGPSTSS